ILVASDSAAPQESSSSPQAGDRAPDATGLQRNFMHHEFRLFDLLRGPKHTLLLYAANADVTATCEKFATIAGELKQRFSGSIQAYVIVHPDCDVPNTEAIPIVVDRRNEFGRLYQADSGGGFLIRPDGYIGYRTSAIDGQKLSEYLDRIFKTYT